MNFKNFLKDSVQKYSYHFVAWMFPVLIIAFLWIAYVCEFYLGDKLDIGTWQTLMWFALFFIPPIVMPICIVEYIITLHSIQYLENTNSDFRFKNNFFDKNLFTEILFLILLVFGVLLFISFVCFTLYLIFVVDIHRELFLLVGLPIAIIFPVSNLFIFKLLKNNFSKSQDECLN